MSSKKNHSLCLPYPCPSEEIKFMCPYMCNHSRCWDKSIQNSWDEPKILMKEIWHGLKTGKISVDRYLRIGRKWVKIEAL